MSWMPSSRAPIVILCLGHRGFKNRDILGNMIIGEQVMLPQAPCGRWRLAVDGEGDASLYDGDDMPSPQHGAPWRLPRIASHLICLVIGAAMAYRLGPAYVGNTRGCPSGNGAGTGAGDQGCFLATGQGNGAVARTSDPAAVGPASPRYPPSGITCRESRRRCASGCGPCRGATAARGKASHWGTGCTRRPRAARSGFHFWLADSQEHRI